MKLPRTPINRQAAVEVRSHWGDSVREVTLFSISLLLCYLGFLQKERAAHKQEAGTPQGCQSQ